MENLIDIIKEFDLILTILLVLVALNVVLSRYLKIKKLQPNIKIGEVMQDKTFQSKIWIAVALIMLATAIPL